MHGRPGNLQTLQMVTIGLFMGLVTMSGVCVMFHGKVPITPGAAPPELMAGAVGALALISTMMLLVLPSMMIKQAAPRFRAQETEEGKGGVVMQTLSTTTIIKCALVEGVGMTGAVAYFL